EPTEEYKYRRAWEAHQRTRDDAAAHDTNPAPARESAHHGIGDDTHPRDEPMPDAEPPTHDDLDDDLGADGDFDGAPFPSDRPAGMDHEPLEADHAAAVPGASADTETADGTPAIAPAGGGGDGGPAKPVTFRGRLQSVFHVAANNTSISFQGVEYSLPRTGRERFANKPLRGELVGGQVKFTNPDGQPFDSRITEATGDQKFIPAGTTRTTLFGVKVSLPKAPAGQGEGEVFEGWHVRVAGEVGRRMVQLSVTGGDAFEPVGDPIPYDEPTEEYKYRRAVEQAGKAYTPPTYSPPDPTDKGAFVGRLPREFRAVAGEDIVSVGSRQVKLPNNGPERFANKPLTGTRTDTEATFTNLDGQWFTHT
ncbi:hypothetical protein AB0K51_34870, partial [Kitasatospora sp. NPDC049285]